MLKNPKAKGNRRERQARDKLIADGYYVIKAGGSLGVFDLIALVDPRQFKEGLPIVRCVQVKSNYCPPKVINEIECFSLPNICSKEIWVYKDHKGVKITCY